MKRPVVDCSITAAWVLGDEDSVEADAVLDQVALVGAFAPSLWWSELRNTLIQAERRGRSKVEDTADALLIVDALDVELDGEPIEEVVLRLARTHGLSVYDALYLELSIRKQRPLATLDSRLKAAAKAEGVL